MSSKPSQFSNGSEPIYFWREFEEPYGFLSQWYDAAFTGPKYFQGPKDENDKEAYRSAEMWMMVQKARLFGDEDISQEMLKTTHPRKHQNLGRKVKSFDKDKWDANKAKIVEEGNYYKFTSNKQGAQLRKLLLETGDRELVEASPTDRIWGIGFSAVNAPSSNRKDWGENLLGKALMRVRQRLRNEGWGDASKDRKCEYANATMGTSKDG